MDEGCVDSSKRRLPMWMTAATTASKPDRKASESNSEEHGDEKLLKGDSRGRKKKKKRNLIEEDDDSGDGVVSIGGKRKNSFADELHSTVRRKRKSKAEASNIVENEEEIEGSSVGQNDEDLTMEDMMNIAREVETVALGRSSISKGNSSGRKKKKQNNIDQGGDSGGRVIQNQGKEKTGRPPRRPKSKAKASRIENGGEVENGEDLTVEDLMSIAKEYVEEDDCAGSTLSSLNIQSEAITELRGSCTGSQPARIKEKEELYPSRVPKTKENIVKPNMSGDPTQDMLNLLLGPLLKSTQEEEKKTNLIANEMSFAYEIKKQSQSVRVTEERAPLMKKKSSLKDKVAMFLD